MHASRVYMAHHHPINSQSKIGKHKNREAIMHEWQSSKNNNAHNKINKMIEIYKRNYKKYVRDIEIGRKKLKMLLIGYSGEDNRENDKGQYL